MGTIVIRTPLEPDEWAAVRTFALEQGEPAGELVADAIRRSRRLAPAFAELERRRRRAKRAGKGRK